MRRFWGTAGHYVQDMSNSWSFDQGFVMLLSPRQDLSMYFPGLFWKKHDHSKMKPEILGKSNFTMHSAHGEEEAQSCFHECAWHTWIQSAPKAKAGDPCQREQKTNVEAISYSMHIQLNKPALKYLLLNGIMEGHITWDRTQRTPWIHLWLNSYHSFSFRTPSFITLGLHFEHIGVVWQQVIHHHRVLGRICNGQSLHFS